MCSGDIDQQKKMESSAGLFKSGNVKEPKTKAGEASVDDDSARCENKTYFVTYHTVSRCCTAGCVTRRLTNPRVTKDTRRALRPADQVEAGGDDVRHLAPSRQVFAHHHLEEIEGRVQAVLVELQLAAQVVDLSFPWRPKKHVRVRG